MLRLFSFLAASIFAAAAGASVAFAAPSFSKADAFYQLVRNDDGAVCCWRSGQVWWTNWNACRNAGGQQTANETCRNSGGGYVDNYSQWQNQNPDERVCCSNRYGVSWSTVRDCRRSGGQGVSNKTCRNAKYPPNYDGAYGYNGNGVFGYDQQDSSAYWNQRVCCSDGYNRPTWSTLGQCRRIRGEQVRNKDCRH